MEFSKKVKNLFNSEIIEENLFSLANYLSSLIRTNSNNINTRNNFHVGIDMRDDKVKEFYDIYPEIIKSIFTSNRGVIDTIEERVTFKEYDFLLQILSPKTLIFSLMEFIMSSRENNFTYDFSNKLLNNDSCLHLYEIKDFSYICSNFSILKESGEYDILNSYILTAFPRMTNIKLSENEEKIKKSSLIPSNDGKSNNLSFLRKSLTGIKNVFNSTSTNTNSSKLIEKIYADPFEYFIINLLFYMKSSNSRLKVKSLETENPFFKNIRTNDNSFGNYILNPNSTQVHLNSLDFTKSVGANFLSRLFTNIFEYLCYPTTEEEYFASNYNHHNSFLDINKFLEVNDLLKKRRLKFTCVMMIFIWFNEFYMRKILKKNILNEAMDLSTLNILVLDNLIISIRLIQKQDFFKLKNNILEYNDDNLISTTLSTPIFYVLNFIFDFFHSNSNLISKLNVTIYNAMDIFKAYILPWASLDKPEILNSLLSNNPDDVRINITNFLFFNIQFYTYLFNKFIICLSNIIEFDLNFMEQLNEILSLYNYSESKGIFFNRLDANIFDRTLSYCRKNDKRDEYGSHMYDKSEIDIYEVFMKNFKFYDLNITDICPWNILDNRKQVLSMVGRWANFVENKLIFNSNSKLINLNSINYLNQEEKEYNNKLKLVIESNIAILNNLYKLHSLGENDRNYSGRKISINADYNNIQEINDTFVLNEMRSKSKNEFIRSTPNNKIMNDESHLSESKSIYSTEGSKLKQVKRFSRTSNSSEVWESNLGSDENFFLYLIFLFLAKIIDSLIDFSVSTYRKITDENYKDKNVNEGNKSKYPKTNLRYFVNKYNFLTTILVIVLFYAFLRFIR